ncbi:response regulator [Microbacterium sp. YY-01]|uniref:response regulator n=1 Tax=Microbacterium sp. YY-01 TaxID=3421634 RepID=UPI003D17E7DA
MTISVLLVDDHPVVRTGLRAVLSEHKKISIVGEAATGEEAIALATEVRPDVVLCDLRLGEGIDGIATTAALRSSMHPPAVIIISTFDRDAEVIGAIEAGAAGYLLKDADPEVIVDGIVRAASGQTALSPELTSRVLQGMSRPLPRLTDREREVLQWAAQGSSNQQIARGLFVTEATVKSHLAHIFTKLDVDSRSRAIHRAQEMGLL